MQFKVLPHNIEAEQSILGSIMLEPEKWDEVSDTIFEEHFYKNAHKTIYSTFRELSLKGQPIDILTASELLTKKGEIEAIGGAAYLAEILNLTPTTANLKSYIDIVLEKSILRKLIGECQSLVAKAYDQDYEDIGSFVDAAEAKIFSIAEKKKVEGLVPANEILKMNMQRIDELYNSGGNGTIGISSGFTDLDKMTAGFQPGELTIIAARPSMGKTAFSLNIATHAAVREGKKVAYFSLEMGQEQLMLRMLASESKIDMSLMRVGKIPDSSWPKLINTVSTLSKSGLYIDESSGISPFEIRAKCRRLKATQGLDMIMVDYLQLMGMKQSRVESREREVSEISKTLKAIAKELKVPVIALAQLNRGVEGRSDRRPMLSDLRESGSIEQDADVIMMIYRDDYYERENSEQKGIAEIIVGKQRNGPTGVAKLAWLSQFGQFANLAPESYASFPSANAKPSGAKDDKPKGPLPNFAPNV